MLPAFKYYILMNLKNLLAAITLIMATTATSALADSIRLPQPDIKGDLTVGEALRQRRSVREYDSKKQLSDQEFSNLLWAAAGINRPADGKRTNPTALNTQEIDLYLFMADGVYLYDFKNNSLDKRVSGDHRALVAGNKEFSQDFVLDAPVSVVIVAETSRYEMQGPRVTLMSMADAGIVSQNINLFCAATGLATVTRATMDADGIRALLGLPATAIPAINNPVGYEVVH